MKFQMFIAGFLLNICYANCQIINSDCIIPCEIDVKLKFQVEATWKLDSVVKEKIRVAEKRYADGIPCIYYKNLTDIIPRVIINNNTDKAFSFSHLYEKDHGILVLEFYRKSKTKMIPIKLRDYDGDVVYDIYIKGKSADSTGLILIDPILPIFAIVKT
jgi:hypothetical protein